MLVERQRTRVLCQFDAINAKQDRNILKVLLARIDEGRRYLASSCRQASSEIEMPPGRALPSSRAAMLTLSPEDISFFDYDVANVDAYADFDALVEWHVLIAFCHPLLCLDGAASSVDGATELNQ